MTLADLPGFASLSADTGALLERVADGDETMRRAALERVAEVVNVFVALDLLQFVFVPPPEGDGDAPATVDLIAPAEPGATPVAWFTVDEAGYDEYRDAVSLFGDLADVMGEPIVLEMADDGDFDGAAPEGGAP